MSLYVYRTKVELSKDLRNTLVEDNDDFFDSFTKLNDSALVSEILATIDRGRYNSELTFIGRTPQLGALSKSMLSTGTKTLLNIISYPDRCFNVVECGINALQFLPKLVDGNVLWKYPLIAYNGNPVCDIVYRGRRFVDFYKFLEFVAKESR